MVDTLFQSSQGVAANVDKMDQQQQEQQQQRRLSGSAPVEIEDPSSKVLPKNNANAVYDVEHLATFSTTANHETITTTTTTSHPTVAGSTSDVANDGDGDGTHSGNGKSSNNGYMYGKSDCVEQQEHLHLVANSGSSRKTSRRHTKPDAIAKNPQVALERLFELEQLTGIWTQRMQIELDNETRQLLIRDCETDQVVERFPSSRVTKPEAFNQFNDIYNNILLFIIEKPASDCREKDSCEDEQATSKNNKKSTTTTSTNKKSQDSKRLNANELDSNRNDDDNGRFQVTPAANSEIHIFQCVSHDARQLVDDILAWKNAEAGSLIMKDYQHGDTRLQPSAASGDTTSAGSARKHQQHDNLHADSGGEKGVRKMIAAGSNSDTRDTNTNKPQSSGNNNNNSKSHSSSKQQVVGPDGSNSNYGKSNGKPAVTLASSCLSNDTVPIVNVNVKETVQVFNQIAALREKR